MFVFLQGKISKLNELSNDVLRDESRDLRYWVLIQVATYIIKIVLTLLQLTGVFTNADLRQFWAVQLEVLICFITEIVPPFYFLRMHVKNNSELRRPSDDPSQIPSHFSTEITDTPTVMMSNRRSTMIRVVKVPLDGTSSAGNEQSPAPSRKQMQHSWKEQVDQFDFDHLL